MNTALLCLFQCVFVRRDEASAQVEHWSQLGLQIQGKSWLEVPDFLLIPLLIQGILQPGFRENQGICNHSRNTEQSKVQHITVRKAADGRVVLSKFQKYQLYHCPFCQPSIFKPRDYASVSAHIESHRLKAVLHREFTIFICHLECRAAKHFHCPYCPKTYVNRSDFTKHIPQCESVCGRDPGATARGPDVTSATARGPDVTSADVTSATARGPGSACPAMRPASKRKIKCRNCSLWLNKNSLKKHQLRQHTSAEKYITAHSNLKRQCFDQDNWVFAEDQHIFPVSFSCVHSGNAYQARGDTGTTDTHPTTVTNRTAEWSRICD
ncbi:uncharacterized protein ACWYII_025837 [Salvelinus alpinus]